jgi:hypothetical protein
MFYHIGPWSEARFLVSMIGQFSFDQMLKERKNSEVDNGSRF